MGIEMVKTLVMRHFSSDILCSFINALEHDYELTGKYIKQCLSAVDLTHGCYIPDYFNTVANVFKRIDTGNAITILTFMEYYPTEFMGILNKCYTCNNSLDTNEIRDILCCYFSKTKASLFVNVLQSQYPLALSVFKGLTPVNLCQSDEFYEVAMIIQSMSSRDRDILINSLEQYPDDFLAVLCLYVNV